MANWGPMSIVGQGERALRAWMQGWGRLERESKMKSSRCYKLLCRTTGKQKNVSFSLNLDQTLWLKWKYTDMLVSLLPGICKPKCIYTILKKQNWSFALYLFFSWSGLFTHWTDPNFYFQGIWAPPVWCSKHALLTFSTAMELWGVSTPVTL